MQPLSSRLLIVTGDQGPGAWRVQAVLPDLPQAETAVLRGYAGLTWSDVAAERGNEILGAMQAFILHHVANRSLTALTAAMAQGEIAGISYRIQRAGPPLVLFPLELSPGQWGPLIPALVAHWTTITLGGAHLGSVASSRSAVARAISASCALCSTSWRSGPASKWSKWAAARG